LHAWLRTTDNVVKPLLSGLQSRQGLAAVSQALSVPLGRLLDVVREIEKVNKHTTMHTSAKTVAADVKTGLPARGKPTFCAVCLQHPPFVNPHLHVALALSEAEVAVASLCVTSAALSTQVVLYLHLTAEYPRALLPGAGQSAVTSPIVVVASKV
jgi:hypothetical protein